MLRADFSGIGEAAVTAAMGRLRAALSPRQLRILDCRRPGFESLPAGAEEQSAAPRELRDARPDPETAAANGEMVGLLGNAVSELSDNDRLLLQLRYEQGLTLAEIAALVNLKDAFAADRRIRGILAQLRAKFSPAADPKTTASRPCSPGVRQAAGQK